MRRHPVIAGLALALAAAPASADQNDPRLAGLFARLKLARGLPQAQALTTRIWHAWFETADGRARLILTDGQTMLRNRRLPEAEAVFTRLVTQAPAFAEGWNRRAIVRYLRGDNAGALRDIARVLSLEPRHFGALAGMGMIYLRQGKLRHALAAFRRAIEINPHMLRARLQIRRLERRLRAREL